MSFRLVLTALVAAVLSSDAAADVLFVDDDAALSGDGSSWDTAFRYLQDALANAVPGTEIRVAQGTYQPDQDEAGNVMPGEREATFRLRDGVVLTGGFAGLGAPDPDERNIESYPTVLSGDLLGNDGPDFQDYDENSYHVVTGSIADEVTSLDGFTITAGNANAESYPYEDGGGMYNASGSQVSHVLVMNCTFVGNRAVKSGGGILNTDSSEVTVANCTFCENQARRGGGMANAQNTSTTVTDCVFSNNTADEEGGGMLSLSNGDITVTTCIFAGNVAEHTGGGAMRNYQTDATVTACLFEDNQGPKGGAIYNISNSDAAISACTFTGNQADKGGAIYNFDGCEPVLSDCAFISNEADLGGGLYTETHFAVPTLTGCSFENNTAAIHGGAIYSILGSHPVVSQCTFDNNQAGGNGGAIAVAYQGDATVQQCLFMGNSATGDGGGLAADGANLTVTGCVLNNNSARQGGGLSAGGGSALVSGSEFAANTATEMGGGMAIDDAASPIVVNCLFVSNLSEGDGGAIGAIGGTPRIANSVIYGNSAVLLGSGLFSSSVGLEVFNCIVWLNAGTQIGGLPIEVGYSAVEGGYPGTHNTGADPLLVDPANGNFRLSPDSPCIDAGHNWAVAVWADTDFDGNHRFADAPAADTGCGFPVVVDMGAYEYQGEPLPVKLGDIDLNGVANVNDFLLLLADWGPYVESCFLADFDLDGEVGFADFLIMLANWG